METTGILCGLAAAACHSVSYIFSRMFLTGGRHSVRRLLISSHLMMGVASVVALPFLWTADVPPLRTFALQLAGTTAFYVLGQAGLFMLVRHTDASLVAPLLSLKIVVLAVLTVTVLHGHVTAAQWAASFVAVTAAFLLGSLGGGLSPSRAYVYVR
jgi:drug/metabolite transporter (DMT)-like permease